MLGNTGCLVGCTGWREGHGLRTIKHPLSGATYDLTPDGSVQVTRGTRSGRFTSEGEWIGGEVRHADPHLCLWMAGGSTPNRFTQAGAAMQPGPVSNAASDTASTAGGSQ